MRKLASVVLVAGLLVGCSGDGEPVSDPTSTSVAPTETAPAESTPQELASIIAGYERDWRTTIDEAGYCRWLWSIETTTVGEELEAITCWTHQTTLVANAKNAFLELMALVAPASMVGLVDETKTVLARISKMDLTVPCGEDTVPNRSKECSQAIGSVYAEMRKLESVLDRWRPYLGS